MQSKGAIRFVAILLVLACLWQLSFTLVTAIYGKRAKTAAEKEVVAAQQSASFANIPEVDRAFYLDSIRKVAERSYTDSITTEKVYFGYTYKDVRAKEINLGLDLKGGMNVMLQVQLQDLVRALSGNNQTPEFAQALELAKQRSVNSQSDYITLFAEAWKEVSGGQRLSQVFGTYEMRDQIKPESTDEEVIRVIRNEAESALSNSFNVLRNRIDRFGVTQPSIQRLGNTGRILVELPGVKEPERVRKLLQGTASLEFWTTFDNSEIYPYLAQANQLLAQMQAAEEPVAEEVAAEEAEKDIVAEELAAQEDNSSDLQAYRKANPLFAVLQPSQARGNACIGYATAADTSAVNRYLAIPQVAEIFPAEFRPMWTVKPSKFFSDAEYYELVAIKADSRDGQAPLDGSSVTGFRGRRDHVSQSVADLSPLIAGILLHDTDDKRGVASQSMAGVFHDTGVIKYKHSIVGSDEHIIVKSRRAVGAAGRAVVTNTDRTRQLGIDKSRRSVVGIILRIGHKRQMVSRVGVEIHLTARSASRLACGGHDGELVVVVRYVRTVARATHGSGSRHL